MNDIEIGSELGNSDHKEIRYNIEWKRCVSENSVRVPDFRKANLSLGRIDWAELNLGGGLLLEYDMGLEVSDLYIRGGLLLGPDMGITQVDVKRDYDVDANYDLFTNILSKGHEQTILKKN